MAGASSITFPNLGFLESQEFWDFCQYGPYGYAVDGRGCHALLPLFECKAFGKSEE